MRVYVALIVVRTRMEDLSSIEPNRRIPEPRRLTPVPSRRWAGFPAAQPPPLGRTREIAALKELLLEPRRRLVTVTGPGGAGKTRLALAVAEDVSPMFTDGAAFVDLASVRDASLLFPAIARALELRDTPGRSPRATVFAVLRDEHLLLVLDNLEHLIDRATAVDLAALLAECPRLALLATSRVALHLHDERLFATPPLALPPDNFPMAPDALVAYGAVALFVDRASLVRQSFTLTPENARAVVEICRRLDGLPLAIELAAAWMRVLAPGALLDRLEPRLELLHGAAADRPERQRTMRDAIAWSYDLLTADEQRYFRSLAVFVGGFTLEAASCIWEACFGKGNGNQPLPETRTDLPASALDLLARLIDRSLLQLVPASEIAPRFTMLETLREFALDRLAERDELAGIAAAHAAHMAVFAEQAEEHLLGADDRAWYARCDAELGNIRAALGWAVANDVETSLRISAALWVYWSVNLLAEGRRWLNAGLVAPAPIDDLLKARALTTDAALACLLGDFAASEVMGRAAVALAEAAGDPVCEARAHWIIASSRFSAGRTDGVESELARALQLFARAATPGPRTHAAFALSISGALALMSGAVDEGIATYEEAVAWLRETGCTGVMVVIFSDFAGWLIQHGETARAKHLLDEALAIATGRSEPLLVGMALFGLVLVANRGGDHQLAAQRLGALEALMARIGIIFPPWWRGRIDQAAGLAREALGDDAFTAAWESGRIDPDQVVAATVARAALDAPHVVVAATDIRTRTPAAGRGLSSREREVLGYLIEGRSDREIAAALFLSRRTVSAHVGSILRKLDVGSRGEAAVRTVLEDLG